MSRRRLAVVCSMLVMPWLSPTVATAQSSTPSSAQSSDATPATATKKPPPVEYFFSRPKFGNITLSPDGKLLVARVTYNNRANLALIDFGSGAIKMLTSLANQDVANYSWIGDRLIEIQTGDLADASGKVYISQIAIIDTDGNMVRDMRPTGLPRIASRIIQFMNDAGDDLIVENNDRSSFGLDAFRYNPRTNQKQLLTIDTPGNVAGYIADHAGQVRVAVSIDRSATRQTLSYRRSNDDKWAKLRDEPIDAVTISPIAFGFDDKTLYVQATSPENGGRAGIYAFDADTNTLGQLVYESRTIDASAIVFDQIRKVPVGVRDDSRDGVTWFDPQWKRLQDSIDAALPKTRNRISWARRDDSRILVSTASDTQPPIFYLLDRKTHQLEQIAEAFPSMKEEDLSPRRLVRYRARDGLSIPAQLTLPRHPNGSKPPLIVIIHGGPFAGIDPSGYNPEAQFFASRGYAVIEPGFRGTTGFGRDFEQAGWRQYGRAMQDDITDGVKWLVDTNRVDPDRVCLFGGSYGGYATLWGLEREPALYRCGIAFVAVSDLELLFDVNWSDTNRGDRDNANRNYYIRTVGDPDRDRAKMQEVSPLYHADRIQAPLLLAYGAADVRVPLIHGNRMRSALDKYDKPYEWVVYNDEGHGFNKDVNKFDFYRRIDAFLAKNLAPRAQ